MRTAQAHRRRATDRSRGFTHARRRKPTGRSTCSCGRWASPARLRYAAASTRPTDMLTCFRPPGRAASTSCACTSPRNTRPSPPSVRAAHLLFGSCADAPRQVHPPAVPPERIPVGHRVPVDPRCVCRPRPQPLTAQTRKRAGSRLSRSSKYSSASRTCSTTRTPATRPRRTRSICSSAWPGMSAAQG